MILLFVPFIFLLIALAYLKGIDPNALTDTGDLKYPFLHNRKESEADSATPRTQQARPRYEGMETYTAPNSSQEALSLQNETNQ